MRKRREISPIECTFWYRGENRELLYNTYDKVRAKQICDYHSNPMMSAYKGSTSIELVHIINWTTENIFYKIDIDAANTTSVKIRIATGMLNKPLRYIYKENKIQLHDNLVRSVKYLREEYAIFMLKSNELPF